MLFLNPYTELFTFDVTAVNALILGSLASGTSYILCSVVSDGGIQLEHTEPGDLDTKMDAAPSRTLLQG
jgi:hypothetical protein